jgi:hypothetical protein
LRRGIGCAPVERLPPESAEAQQVLDEFIANFKAQYPTEYMGMAILHHLDRLSSDCAEGEDLGDWPWRTGFQ